MRVFAALLTVALCAAMAAHAQLPVQPASDQARLLESPDPKLAANKRLVYDFWREVFEGGHMELADKYMAEGYIQHNPNVASGRDQLAAFIKGSRPVRPIAPTISFPLISIVAEGDMVVPVLSGAILTHPAGRPTGP